MGICPRPLGHLLAAAVLAAVLCAPGSAVAQEAPTVTSGDLVERAQEWDGKRVSFTGEAIGSVMVRGDMAWLHLNDDAYGVASGEQPAPLAGYNAGHAVRVPARLARQVARVGASGVRGDLVRVEGTFRAADPLYGGDMLIDADSLSVVREGRELRAELPAWKMWWLVAVAVTTATAYVALDWRKRRHLIGTRRP